MLNSANNYFFSNKIAQNEADHLIELQFTH